MIRISAIEWGSPRENVFVKQEWNTIKQLLSKNVFLSVF